MNFILPATFFRAHQIQQKPSNPKITVEALQDYVTNKTAFFRNRLNMAKYDEDGLGSLTREVFRIF